MRYQAYFFVLVIAITACFSLPAQAQTQYGLRSFDAENEQAKAFLNTGQAALARPIFERGAALGDVRALNNLGNMYRHGQDVAVDMPKAINLLKKASQGGLPHADFNLGWIYFGSADGYIDLPQSRTYWQKAVDADFAPAFALLARHYDGASELPRDPERVKVILERGAALGDKESAYALAHMLLSEEPPLGDPAAARKMLATLSQGGFAPAMMLRGDIARLGLAGNKISYVSALGDYQDAKEAGATLASAKIEAMAPLWYMESKQRVTEGDDIGGISGLSVQCDLTDYLPACHQLAHYYYNGTPYRGRDIVKAITYLRKTCDLGELSACIPYANAIVVRGPSSDRADIDRAAQMLSDECMATPPSYAACYNLGYMEYYTGFGVGSYDSMKRHLTEACFNGGYQPACPMAFEVFNSEARTRRASQPKSNDAIGGLLTMFAENFMDSERAAAQAGQGANYEKYRSTSSSANSGTFASSNRAQDNRDFNNYINAVNSIGTGYNSSCPSSNPYC